MTEHDKTSARRNVLRAGLAVIAAGVAGTAIAKNTLAQDKLAKDAVQYQTTPKDGAKCSTCVNFVAPAACQIVSGDIDPNGWCIAYGPKGT